MLTVCCHSSAGPRTLPGPQAAASRFPVFHALPGAHTYGGSTATGLLGIQFAKLSGARVAVTCSPRNFDLVKSLGADAAFDYSSPTVSADIKAWGANAIAHVWDCFATPECTKIAVAAMADSAGRYQALLPVNPTLLKSINPNVESGVTMMYTVFGEPFQKGHLWSASPEDLNTARCSGSYPGSYWRREGEASQTGRTGGGKGLDGVLVGLDELRKNKVSGSKLVYTL